MTTITPGQLIPDGLARRLAGHYSTNTTDTMACLYWTGQVLPGTSLLMKGLCKPEYDSRGLRDPQAILAELRALAHYCRTHDGRGEVEGWREWDPDNGYDDVVPWAWREEATA